METTKTTITFEHSDDITSDQLHEFLCLSIHEGQEDTLDKLMTHVVDIIQEQQGKPRPPHLPLVKS